jgi:hypothetical protein
MGRRNERCEHFRTSSLLKLIGGIAIAVVAVGVISQIHDIRRYIKMSTM